VASTLIFIGIWIIVFLFLFWLTDIKMYIGFFAFLKPAGENTMTAYLFPFLVYNLIWLAGIPIFFYRHYGTFMTITGSAIVAILMMILSSILIKMNVKLKI
jgi:hypothetical protein